MDLTSNVRDVRRRIQAACERANRDPETVALVAVTKSHPPQTVTDAVEAGLTLFGENKVQEAKAKISRCPGYLHWHMIGHLQTNKCRDAVHFFEMIQSVDSMKVAIEINKWADRAAKSMPVLLEANVAGEASKQGYDPAAVLEELNDLNDLPNLEIHGLMTIAPFSPNAETVRPNFVKLRELKSACEDRLGAPLPVLSMGMSNDFEVAIEEGATMVRLGTCIFGPRAKRKKVDAD